MEITNAEIQTDIAGFQERIQTAENKLTELPRGYRPYREYKQLQKTKHELELEIEHCKRLIGYAEEALKWEN